MSVVRVLQYPDPRLKKIGKRVDVVDDKVKAIIDSMFETHYALENCAALAATQLDFEDPLAITVIDLSLTKDQPLCLVNPEIVEAEGEQYESEGCMSVYPEHFHERVKRAYKIKVCALDQEGKEIVIDAEDYLAKCIQHEVDHLNGLTYLDRISPLKRKRIENKLKKILKDLD